MQTDKQIKEHYYGRRFYPYRDRRYRDGRYRNPSIFNLGSWNRNGYYGGYYGGYPNWWWWLRSYPSYYYYSSPYYYYYDPVNEQVIYQDNIPQNYIELPQNYIHMAPPNNRPQQAATSAAVTETPTTLLPSVQPAQAAPATNFSSYFRVEYLFAIIIILLIYLALTPSRTRATY